MTSHLRLRRSNAPKTSVYAVMPTLLTLGNSICGFASITYAAMVGPQSFGDSASQITSANGMLFASASFILLAMCFDALDGSVARLSNNTSEFGSHLDSLCDVISFGVAPAFLMLKLMHPGHRMMETIAPMSFQYPPRFLWAIAVMFMVCAILRLARFNSELDDADSHRFFKGLPTPAAAGAIASFPVGLQGLKDVANESTLIGKITLSSQMAERILSPLSVVLPILVLAVSLLMVSRFRYPHLVNQFLRPKGNRTRLLTVLSTIGLIFLFHEMAVPVIFCCFAFIPPLRSIQKNLWSRSEDNPPQPTADH
jgi:CDP-diacylglycerol--serine O-phosphatidyltransferase